jgi:TPR repeat protein
MVRARLGGAPRRRGAMARAALAAALVLGMFPSSASGDVGSPTRVVTPTVKVVSRLEAPKPWVGAREVHENRTLNTDVVEGTVALGGTFALVIRDDALPALPPTNPAFTIAMRVFLTHDPTHDAYVGLFWKGRGNDDRTPSAWLAPGSTLVTFRVSTTVSTEVWGTANTPLPVREWCHIALSVDGRIMRFYVNGVLDVAVETNGDVVSNDGNLHIGKDPANPGLSGFLGAVQMHALALRDEDVQQMAARAMHAAPDFDGEPAREARVAPRLAAGVLAREAAHFRAVFDANASSDAEAPEVTTGGLSDALDADHLASFAEEQFALGDAARAAALKLADAASRPARSRVAAERVMATALEPLLVAAAGGHNEARLVLAAMLEGGYGTSDSAPKPGRALYHRLMAAASGDPMARLAMGAATVLGNDAFLSGADAGSAVGSPTSRLPNARCALALHYFYHSATTAYEDSARPGGQARVERGRLHENTRRVKGDLRGESDDRVLYLSRAADLGDARAMLAMGNGYYWGNFGLPRDHAAALRFYRRAHRAGALQGTVGVAKMALKGEGAPRNTSEALEHYRAAAERGSADALNGLGYLYFYGDDADVAAEDARSAADRGSADEGTGSLAESSGFDSSVIHKNDTLALEYFRRAAELGNGDGLVNAGVMLRSGLGTPADVAAAHALFARCAELPGEHPACSYQAALIEASGEGGVPRDCDLAVARLRRVAEGGRWMAPLQEGMQAHLAGRKNEAAWLYEYASAGSLPEASFNAAWLGERDARDARVARRFGTGVRDENWRVFVTAANDDDDDDDDDATNDDAVSRADAETDDAPDSELAAVAFSREKRAATSLRRHAARVRADPEADDAARAWAALQLADCEYYGAARPGGCAPGSKREALRLYREAAASARAALATVAPATSVTADPGRNLRRWMTRAAKDAKEPATRDPAPSREAREAAARAAEDAGGSLDARRLLTHALYAEAWMRAKGEACSADRARARRALGEALGVGGWRELVAVAPPFAGLALLDLVDAACAALATPPSGTPRRCADALMALMAPSASDGDEDVVRRAERRAPSDAPEKEAKAAGDVAPRRARLSPGAFALRLVSELIAAAGAWEDAVAQHAERWRFTLALSRSLLAAAVAFALGWRLAARPLLRALHGARDAREAAPRRDRGGGSVGEMRRRVERMRAEAAAEAERAREASAARAVTEPPPPAAVRAPVDVGDLDDSSAEGHAVIRARGDEGGDR